MFLLSIKRISGYTLTILNLIKKKLHKSKQPIELGLVTIHQIVIFDKSKHSGEGFKYFIGYQEGEIFKPLCIILPQMSGYIKCFENSRKNKSFLLKMMKCRKNTNKFGM